MSSNVLNRTSLYEAYARMPNVRLVDFGGWELPLEYGGGIVAEHRIVRDKAGLFDVSHMGEILVEGSSTWDFLNWVLTNEIDPRITEKAVYTPMCYPDGGTVDDLLVYPLGPDRALLVVNAANTDKDVAWLQQDCPWPHGYEHLRITNVSDSYAQLALQGPRTESILSELTSFPLSTLGYYEFRQQIDVAGSTVLLSRTGYTGEDGFELYIRPEDAVAVWNTLCDAGFQPVGLGARDTLRMEARLPLYGHELTSAISPIEAGLSVFVRAEKKDFCGKEALASEQGRRRIVRGIVLKEPGVPRQGYPVSGNGVSIGEITSGGKSPTLDAFIALALVKRGAVKTGDTVTVHIRGKEKQATVVKTPFYRNVKS